MPLQNEQQPIARFFPTTILARAGPGSHAGGHRRPPLRSRTATAWIATRQDAHQDQRRRQGRLPVRGCGQARSLRPQDQRLRQLPRRHHGQASRRQRAGRSRSIARAATSGNPRVTAPASTAWRSRPARRLPPPARTAMMRTRSCRPRRRLRRLFLPAGGDLRRVPRQEARRLGASVHGKAVPAGHRDAPTCTDCHSEHKIRALKGSSALKISRMFAAAATPPSG